MTAPSYILPNGTETSRPRYLAYVLARCLSPATEVITPQVLMERAAEKKLEISAADAAWSIECHRKYLARRANEETIP